MKKLTLSCITMFFAIAALAQLRVEQTMPESNYNLVLTTRQIKQTDNYEAVLEVFNIYTNKRLQRVVLGDEYSFANNESIRFADMNIDGYDDIIINNASSTHCGYWTTSAYLLLYNAKTKKFEQTNAFDEIMYAGHYNDKQVQINHADSTIRKYKQTCLCDEGEYGYHEYKLRKGKPVLAKSVYVLCPALDIEKETGSRQVVFGITTNGRYAEYTKRLTASQLRELAGLEVLAVE